MTRLFLPLLAFVVLGGVGALALATEGFRALTSEGAWQIAVARHPVRLPNVNLLDQNGRAFSFANYRGKKLLVDFIYTRCPTICGVLGDEFHRAESSAVAKRDMAFLSISFDPKDNRAALKAYAERHGAVAPNWRVAAPAHASERTLLLKTFGVTVIPDRFGGFVHSDDVYLVDENSRLVRVIPYGTADLTEVAGS